jgi:hypothetical protein
VSVLLDESKVRVLLFGTSHHLPGEVYTYTFGRIECSQEISLPASDFQDVLLRKHKKPKNLRDTLMVKPTPTGVSMVVQGP